MCGSGSSRLNVSWHILSWIYLQRKIHKLHSKSCYRAAPCQIAVLCQQTRSFRNETHLSTWNWFLLRPSISKYSTFVPGPPPSFSPLSSPFLICRAIWYRQKFSDPLHLWELSWWHSLVPGWWRIAFVSSELLSPINKSLPASTICTTIFSKYSRPLSHFRPSCPKVHRKSRHCILSCSSSCHSLYILLFQSMKYWAPLTMPPSCPNHCFQARGSWLEAYSVSALNMLD